MKNINNFIFIVSIFLFVGCKDDSLSTESVINSSQITETTLDKWIDANFTQPYNIAVEYRWNSNTAPKGSHLYPPRPENVKKVLEAIKYLWLETYELPRLGGENFMKGKSPVVIRMFGGKNLDARGVELLDNPEATGTELYIYNVDSFDAGSKDKVFLLMRSVHHQFAKKLAEVIPYDRDKFLAISEKKYTGSTEKIARLKYDSRVAMFSFSNSANKQGFCTIHGTISAEDDFAEIISATLTHTPRELSEAEINAKIPYQDYGSDSQVQEQYNQQAKQSYKEFMAKQKMVQKYFEKKIKINLTRLQLASIQRINMFVDNHQNFKK